jgi:ubiquinone/menaquinone biosynthesis C-methylase UbiE
MTFWDFCAPFYDAAQRRNRKAYAAAGKAIRGAVPGGSAVLEVAAGTGEFGLAVAGKARHVLCTDISERMLAVARKKAARRGADNIGFGRCDIFAIPHADGAFDVVIAGQVLHLVNSPERAAAELRRVASRTVIMPLSLTKGLKGFPRLMLRVWKRLGFAPKQELAFGEYAAFLREIGFEGCEIIPCDGPIPMAVAVWNKQGRAAA